MVQQVKHKTP